MSVGLFERHLESVDDPGLLETRTARQPIGRILDPEEVARTAAPAATKAAAQAAAGPGPDALALGAREVAVPGVHDDAAM